MFTWPPCLNITCLFVQLKNLIFKEFMFFLYGSLQPELFLPLSLETIYNNAGNVKWGHDTIHCSPVDCSAGRRNIPLPAIIS
jgi:hypothetical protein